MSVKSPVLEVFEKVNPSQVDIEDVSTWQKYATRQWNRFTFDYRLPPPLLRDRSVLDVGCGTGEKALVMASWGARVWGLDFNERALARARELAANARVAHRPQFVYGALPELPEAVSDERFDVVHADGVLHHAPDQLAAARVLAARVALGGFLVIRNYHPITAMQRLLKRAIVHVGIDEEDHDGVVASVRRLFAEDIRRSVEIGGRGEEQAIYDNFVVAAYVPLSTGKLLKVCRDEGLEVYASTPAADAAALLGPGSLRRAGDNHAPTWAAWWTASAARTLIATGTSTTALGSAATQLEDCGQCAVCFERTLGEFLGAPSAERWDALVTATGGYLKAARDVVGAVHQDSNAQIEGFLGELEAISPALRAALNERRPVAELPSTEVLFRGASGMPMATWVLQRTEAASRSPLR